MSPLRVGWRRALTLLLIAAAAAFLAHTAATNWRELSSFEWRVRGGLLALSVVAHVAVLAWGVLLWGMVLHRFAAPAVGYRRLLQIWAVSNATRYVPGVVWQFLTAAQLSRDAGLPGVLALTSLLVHVAFSLLAALTVSVATLPLEALGLAALAPVWARAAVVGLALLAVHPGVINLGLRMVPRVLHREVLVWHGSWAAGIGLLALANLSWLFYGGAYALFVASLAPIPAAAYLPLTAVNALSFAIGYVAVVAPGGLGVRESAMTLLLAPVLPLGVATVVAVAARLWSIAAEVALAVGGTLLARGRGGAPER